jgi:hypothetical protein
MRLAHMRNSVPMSATRHASPGNQCFHAREHLNKLAATSRYVINGPRYIQVAHADLQFSSFQFHRRSPFFLFFLLPTLQNCTHLASSSRPYLSRCRQYEQY